MENRYDKYKDSGIAWIGEIPEHWKVIPHKRIMRKKKIIKEFYAGENILSLTKKGVIIRDLEAGGKMPTTFNGYQVLYPDNLLMCLFDIDVTPRCVGIIKDEGLSSPAYSQFILNELGYTPFFDYLLRYMDDEKCLLHLSKNLRNSLTEDDFGQIETIVPSFPEQQAIADYLDWKCGEIDELITLQEEMITKLQSYKQSVITEAVTKGLDKNVPLKDSGIEWIGEIPEHWKVAKIKSFYNVILGKMVERNNDSNTGDENYLCAANIKWNGVDTEINKKMYFSDIEKEKYLLQYNDVLIMEGGMAGTACLYKNEFSPCYVQNSVNVCRAKKDFNNKFLYYWMYVPYYNGYIDAICNKATIRHYTKEKVQNTPILISSLVEQQSIATYLDQKCSEIDKLISIKQQKIEKLKEYKKSLIFECVTGKRKVS